MGRLALLILLGALAWWWTRGEPGRGNHVMEGCW